MSPIQNTLNACNYACLLSYVIYQKYLSPAVLLGQFVHSIISLADPSVQQKTRLPVFSYNQPNIW